MAGRACRGLGLRTGRGRQETDAALATGGVRAAAAARASGTSPASAGESSEIFSPWRMVSQAAAISRSAPGNCPFKLQEQGPQRKSPNSCKASGVIALPASSVRMRPRPKTGYTIGPVLRRASAAAAEELHQAALRRIIAPDPQHGEGDPQRQTAARSAGAVVGRQMVGFLHLRELCLQQLRPAFLSASPRPLSRSRNTAESPFIRRWATSRRAGESTNS